jgi:hypothetical protein
VGLWDHGLLGRAIVAASVGRNLFLTIPLMDGDVDEAELIALLGMFLPLWYCHSNY